MLTQQRGGLVANVADAKAENQLIKIVALRAFDCVQKVLCALFLEFVQRKQLLLGQGVQVSYRGDQPLVDELYGHSLAQAVNGHGVAGRKVDEVAQALRGAFGVDAAQGCFVLQMHTGAPQLGQVVGMAKACCPADRADTPMTSGMMSPALRTLMVSPMPTPKFAIISPLCRLARETLVPARKIGSNTAVGVSTPVRPTVTSISRTVLSLTSGGYLKAIAQRGNLLVLPRA